MWMIRVTLRQQHSERQTLAAGVTTASGDDYRAAWSLWGFRVLLVECLRV